MAHQKKKEIEYRNPYMLGGLLIISWGFTLLAVWERYLAGSIFFCFCALVFTYPILDPRKKIIFTGTRAYRARMDKEFNERYADPGIFRYTDDGFDIDTYNELVETSFHVKWTEIRAMFAYKADQFATDLISLDVFSDDNHSFRVTEDTRGWYVFLEKIATQFPTIDELWNLEIAVPAFETKLTLIYEREGRTLAEAEDIYYKIKKKD